VAIEGSITRTKWSHIPIIFSEADIKLVSFPHIDAMIIIAHINKWDVTRVLVDNGSQAEILFLLAFDQMGFDRKQLKEASNNCMVSVEKELSQWAPYLFQYLLVAFTAPAQNILLLMWT
jgi:hypothetical protein